VSAFPVTNTLITGNLMYFIPSSVYITVYFPSTYTICFSQHTRINRTSVIISVSWLYYNITHHTIGCICAVDIVTYIESINMLELIIRGD
jgi:hypothetical protein